MQYLYPGPYIYIRIKIQQKISYCSVLQFLNDFESWQSDGGDQRLTDTYGQNIPRMPRKMFYQTSDSPLARYNHLVSRADFCSNLDLTTAEGLNKYTSHFNCKNPWHRPGFAKIVSSCGISGGLQGEYGNSKDIMKDLYPYGQPAETYNYPNALTTQWKRGKNAKVPTRLVSYCIVYFILLLGDIIIIMLP